MRARTRDAQRGALMIEVLITIVILAIGLLGLMQMQGRLQKSEMESYQRTQAILLVNDMASRIQSNPRNAADYVIGDPNDPSNLSDPNPLGGIGVTCGVPAPTTMAGKDSAEWCNALQGAAEEMATSNQVGAMLGARGCVHGISGREFLVSVVWQGLTPISAPPDGVACGKLPTNPYDGDADCVDDLCRRYVTTIVRLGSLPP
jgi:type IV pilus assembly protein PilV